MIATVVLAAGLSSRFGSPKLLAEWFGAPLVERAFSVAPPIGPRIAVVGHEEQALRPLAVAHGLAVVVNHRPEDGLAASLRAVFAVLPAEVTALLVLLGDAPVVSELAVGRVLEAFRRLDAPVVASYDAGRGHPAVLPRASWETVPESGDRAGAVVDATPVECGDLGPGGSDVDTPDDLFSLAARVLAAPLVHQEGVEGLETVLGSDGRVVIAANEPSGRRRKGMLKLEDLRAAALAHGRNAEVVARAGDRYACLVG